MVILHRAILLLFAISGLIQQASGENQSVFECKHVKASELMRAYAPVVAAEAGGRINEEGSKVLVTGGRSRLHERLRELKPLVDFVRISPPTKFIRLHHVDAGFASALVSKAFARGEKEEDSLHAVASPRTKQVFVFGELKDVRAAEALLLKLDQFCGSASGGDSWRMFGWAGCH